MMMILIDVESNINIMLKIPFLYVERAKGFNMSKIA